MKHAIVDTGSIVALLNARDEYHDWARDAFGEIEPPLLTCEAVIAEACFVLRGIRGGQDAVMELLERGIVRPQFSLARELTSVRKLMQRYASVPMSVADASLVRMSEIDTRTTVVTLDSDFRVYRRNGRQVVPLISPR